MAGYAATGRISRGHPRFVGSGASHGSDRVAGYAADDWSVRRGAADGRPLDVRLAAWIADARDEWAQATFFLFDPNSWR